MELPCCNSFQKSDSKVDMSWYVCLILPGKVCCEDEMNIKHQAMIIYHPLYFLDLQAERSKLATQSEIAHGALAALALEKRSMRTVS